MIEVFDHAIVDGLLSTTRAVRKRLDFSTPVEREVILDCVRLAQQAPTGSNMQNWRWIFVEDPEKKAEIAAAYRRGGMEYLQAASAMDSDDQTTRVISSALYLAEHLHEAPVLAIPCLLGRLGPSNSHSDWCGMLGSIFPSVWSFQLALRSRGLGSCLTTLHLAEEASVSELLGIPDYVMQIALLPVAYTKGIEFNPASRPSPDTIVSWNQWD